MGNRNDSLGDRMKRYEAVSKGYLMRRTPAIIRLDGKSFHTFTKGFKKPYDNVLLGAMDDTMRYLCGEIQGCVFGYTQSDEISLVLIDYQNIDTSAWFNYNIQKLCSVAASMATAEFNVAFTERAKAFSYQCVSDTRDWEVAKAYADKLGKALFDARVFSLPKEEVCNYFIWRQRDAIRNSIQQVGHTYFSDKELHGKKSNEIVNMLLDSGVNWNEYPSRYRRGSCCMRMAIEVPVKVEGEIRYIQDNRLVIDSDIPDFTDKREYIESLL